MSKSKSTKKPKSSRADSKAETARPKTVSHKSTKQSLLVEMLSKKPGAHIDAIVKAMGWLPHTGRAMISGLRKAGHKVETEPGKDGKTIYRIVGTKKAAGKAAR